MAIAQQQYVIEARMRRFSEEIMADIEKRNVDFQLNFDDTLMNRK
jgi:DNA gyrase subunit A